MSERLRNFVADLLEHSGAVIERIEPDGLEVLSPADVRAALSLPELARLGFSPELPSGAQRVGLESDWLERFHGLMGEHGNWARLSWESGQSLFSNPEKILEHGLVLNNAVFRLESVQPAWTRYLLLVFRFTAMSEEKREGVIRVGFNMANGATLDGFLDSLWSELLLDEPWRRDASGISADVVLPEVWEVEKVFQVVRRALPLRVAERLERFIQGLKRRQNGDIDRLHGYFSDMQKEIVERMAKEAKGEAADAEKFTQRLASIEREYHSKVNDLRQKYALRVDTRFVQGMILEMPVYRLHLLIKRKKGERHFHLDWNPVVRKLETPPCEYSFTWTTARVVCDEALHLVSAEAHAGCRACGKSFCRACHGEKCPKCGQA
ncbi:MAG: uncharacterized protein HW380_641 [Magnetococcales bacterium]|nr:uncharacterized protein [Magnetococcales bacterium]